MLSIERGGTCSILALGLGEQQPTIDEWTPPWAEPWRQVSLDFLRGDGSATLFVPQVEEAWSLQNLERRIQHHSAPG